MIETQYQYIKFVGLACMILGSIGFGYLLWVFVLWSNFLPSFPTESEYLSVYPQHQNTRSPNSNTLGFGNLLIESNNRNDGSSEIALEPNSVQSTAENQQVLGDQSNRDQSVTLTIPRLDLENKIVELHVDGTNESIYDTVLTSAVAHLENSALPGQFGNTFLFGHSKLPIFAGSDYESIFTNLPKVKVGDIVRVAYGDTEYTYQIRQTGVVNPEDVYVMHQPENKKMITLMTCIPPGFDHQRYITVGELVKTATR